MFVKSQFFFFPLSVNSGLQFWLLLLLPKFSPQSNHRISEQIFIIRICVNDSCVYMYKIVDINWADLSFKWFILNFWIFIFELGRPVIPLPIKIFILILVEPTFSSKIYPRHVGGLLDISLILRVVRSFIWINNGLCYPCMRFLTLEPWLSSLFAKKLYFKSWAPKASHTWATQGLWAWRYLKNSKTI